MDNGYENIIIYAVSENEDLVTLNTTENNILTGNVLTLIPAPNAVGIAAIEVFASDGQPNNSESDTMNFNLTILDVNDLPIISGLPGSGQSGTDEDE